MCDSQPERNQVSSDKQHLSFFLFNEGTKLTFF